MVQCFVNKLCPFESFLLGCTLTPTVRGGRKVPWWGKTAAVRHDQRDKERGRATRKNTHTKLVQGLLSVLFFLLFFPEHVDKSLPMARIYTISLGSPVNPPLPCPPGLDQAGCVGPGWASLSILRDSRQRTWHGDPWRFPVDWVWAATPVHRGLTPFSRTNHLRLNLR